MKIFLKAFFKFIAFAIPVYILMIIVWSFAVPVVWLKKNLSYPKAAYGYTYTRFKDAKLIKNTDILFLGSSHAYRGFDPRIFEQYGISSFDLGSSAQSPVQTKILLERYLKRLNPKLVIFEVYPETFTTDGVESSIDLLANDKNDWGSIKMGIKQMNLKVLNTLILSLFKDGFDKQNLIENHKKEGDTYIPGGFVERIINTRHPYKPYSSQAWSFKNVQFLAFKECIDLINQQKTNLLLIQAPITQELYKSYINNTYFDSLMNTYGTYYNFNNFMKLNDSLFADDNHLNEFGVQVFNKGLIDILNKKDVFQNTLKK